MKREFLTLPLALTLTACATKQPTATSQIEIPNIALEIEVTPTTVRATENMQLYIRIRNLSRHHSIPISESDPIRDFNIEVRNAEGKTVELTPTAKQMLTQPIWRYSVTSLPPSQSWQTSISLRSYFLLDEPGRYHITVSRSFSLPIGTTVQARSNAADLHVNEIPQ